MIPKSGHRFSEKIMLKQESQITIARSWPGCKRDFNRLQML